MRVPMKFSLIFLILLKILVAGCFGARICVPGVEAAAWRVPAAGSRVVAAAVPAGLLRLRGGVPSRKKRQALRKEEEAKAGLVAAADGDDEMVDEQDEEKNQIKKKLLAAVRHLMTANLGKERQGKRGGRERGRERERESKRKIDR